MSLHWKRKYIKDIVLAIAITVLPFLLSIHLMYSEEKDVLHFRDFSYHHGYANNSTFIWTVLISLIPILLFVLWFLTSRYWWRYFILGPIFSNIIFITEIICVGPYDIHCMVVSILTFLMLLFFANRYAPPNIISKPHAFSISFLKAFKGNFKGIYTQIRGNVSSLQNEKNHTQEDDYVKKLYHTKAIIDEKVLSKGLVQQPLLIKPKAEKLLVALLLATPVCFFIHLLIPSNTQSYAVGSFVIGSNGFLDVHTFIWYLCLKLCILLPLSIWFITAQQWWRYAVLCPIIIFTHQLWTSLKNAKTTVDELEYLRALPFIVILVVILLLLSQAIRYQSKILDIYEQISKEIELLLDGIESRDTKIERMQLQFNQLKKTGITELEAKQQLEALLALKLKLEKQLHAKKD